MDYVLLISFGAALFFIVPWLALLLFIMVSGYHFGEQHWEDLKINNSNLVIVLFQFCYGLLILVLLFTYFAQSAFAAEKCAMSHQLTDSSKKIYCLDKFDFSKRKYSNFNIPLDSAARASNCWSLAIPTEESCNNIIGF